MLAGLKARVRRTRWPWAERPDCAYVISFPKSGRTWHKLMVGHYLAQLTGAPEKNAFKVASLCRRAGLKPIEYSHNDTGFKDGLPPSSRLVASPQLWQGRPVLFLVRNPRDVLVSAYHHATTRATTRFHGTLSEFVRRPETGIAKVMKAYVSWNDRSGMASASLVHSYEEMHRDPAAVLTSSLRFFGLSEIDPRMVAAAVEFCRFDNMQRYERLDMFGAKQLRNASGSPTAAKVREGRVGSYQNALSASDLEFIDAYIAQSGDPFERLY